MMLIQRANGHREWAEPEALTSGDMIVLVSGDPGDAPPPIPPLIATAERQPIKLMDADGNELKITVHADVDPVTRSDAYVRYLIRDRHGNRKTFYAAPSEALAIAREVIAAIDEGAAR